MMKKMRKMMMMMRGQRAVRNFKRSLQDSLCPVNMGKYAFVKVFYLNYCINFSPSLL